MVEQGDEVGVCPFVINDKAGIDIGVGFARYGVGVTADIGVLFEDRDVVIFVE